MRKSNTKRRPNSTRLASQGSATDGPTPTRQRKGLPFLRWEKVKLVLFSTLVCQMPCGLLSLKIRGKLLHRSQEVPCSKKEDLVKLQGRFKTSLPQSSRAGRGKGRHRAVNSTSHCAFERNGIVLRFLGAHLDPSSQPSYCPRLSFPSSSHLAFPSTVCLPRNPH